jgi:hypothetical protein
MTEPLNEPAQVKEMLELWRAELSDKRSREGQGVFLMVF